MFSGKFWMYAHGAVCISKTPFLSLHSKVNGVSSTFRLVEDQEDATTLFLPMDAGLTLNDLSHLDSIYSEDIVLSVILNKGGTGDFFKFYIFFL